ncbi:HEPN domain-containing protein [Pyrococcus abyssi]|uniref:HEPN domain-containing protein n=1 Tax=Pyrococcus abyssi TaxID=29292 RepID=UPI00187282CB|nr:HEPN domain-containing protein [Pyrococcus abyssi]
MDWEIKNILLRNVSPCERRLELYPNEIFRYAKTLDKHYIPTRYPDAYIEGARSGHPLRVAGMELS